MSSRADSERRQSWQVNLGVWEGGLLQMSFRRKRSLVSHSYALPTCRRSPSSVTRSQRNLVTRFECSRTASSQQRMCRRLTTSMWSCQIHRLATLAVQNTLETACRTQSSKVTIFRRPPSPCCPARLRPRYRRFTTCVSWWLVLKKTMA